MLLFLNLLRAEHMGLAKHSQFILPFALVLKLFLCWISLPVEYSNLCSHNIKGTQKNLEHGNLANGRNKPHLLCNGADGANSFRRSRRRVWSGGTGNAGP